MTTVLAATGIYLAIALPAAMAIGRCIATGHAPIAPTTPHTTTGRTRP